VTSADYSSSLHRNWLSLRQCGAVRNRKEDEMDRRGFIRGLFGVAVAVGAAGAAGLNTAEAAPMPIAPPPSPGEADRVESDYRPDVDGAPTTDNVQYYYRRPRRRVVYYRRPRRIYYRPRPVYYRRPRRVFYRPRPIYYRRPRPVYYRRRYW